MRTVVAADRVVCERCSVADRPAFHAELRVLPLAASLPPWRLEGARGAPRVLELAGECARSRPAPGDLLELRG